MEFRRLPQGLPLRRTQSTRSTDKASEKNIPTEQSPPQAHPRLSASYAYPPGQSDHQSAPQEGTRAPECLVDARSAGFPERWGVTGTRGEATKTSRFPALLRAGTPPARPVGNPVRFGAWARGHISSAWDHRDPQSGGRGGTSEDQTPNTGDLSSLERAAAVVAVRHRGACKAESRNSRLCHTADGNPPPPGAVDSTRARGWLSRGAVALLVAYKRWISPLLPKSCRFTPTCSEYTRMAIVKYGLLRGCLKGFGRILRCGPWSRGGVDMP